MKLLNQSGWTLVMVAGMWGLAGCDVFRVAPEDDVVSAILVRGTIAGDPISLHPGEDGVSLVTGSSNGGAWSRWAEFVMPAEAAGESDRRLRFELQLNESYEILSPWSEAVDAGVVPVELATGNWWATDPSEKHNLRLLSLALPDAEWTVNGVVLDESDWAHLELPLPGSFGVLETSAEGGSFEIACEFEDEQQDINQTIEMEWSIANFDCGERFVPAPFRLWSDGGHWFVHPPMSVPGLTWKWTVNGEQEFFTPADEAVEPLQLDGVWGGGSMIEVVLEPVDPEGAWGDFSITRTIDYQGANLPMIAELMPPFFVMAGWEARPVLKVTYTDRLGVVHQTLTPCQLMAGGVAGSFEVTDIVPFETSEQGHPTDLLSVEASFEVLRPVEGENQNWPPVPGTELEATAIVLDAGSKLAFPQP